MAGTKQGPKRTQQVKTKVQKPVAAPPPKQVSQFAGAAMGTNEAYLSPPTTRDERERSHTPPMFAYSTYPPPPEDMLLNSYNSMQPYRPITTDVYSEYLTAAVPVTLPSVTHFSDAMKRDQTFATDDSLSPYMSYGTYLPALDLNGGATSPYDNSNPLVSPLRNQPPTSSAPSRSAASPSAAAPLPVSAPVLPQYRRER
jgi:hypothetical protein